jgi:hypothetical protein
VLLSLTPAGRRLMEELFPAFNQQEAFVTSTLTAEEVRVLSAALRKIVLNIEEAGANEPLVPVAAPRRRRR